MENIYKRDIKIIKSYGWFHVTINGVPVTKDFTTRGAAYKDYIVKLLKSQNTIKKALEDFSTGE